MDWVRNTKQITQNTLFSPAALAIIAQQQTYTYMQYMGVVLNNEDIATVKKERDLCMTFMDSEIHCWCAAGGVSSSGASFSDGSDEWPHERKTEVAM